MGFLLLGRQLLRGKARVCERRDGATLVFAGRRPPESWYVGLISCASIGAIATWITEGMDPPILIVALMRCRSKTLVGCCDLGGWGGAQRTTSSVLYGSVPALVLAERGARARSACSITAPSVQGPSRSARRSRAVVGDRSALSTALIAVDAIVLLTLPLSCGSKR